MSESPGFPHRIGIVFSENSGAPQPLKKFVGLAVCSGALSEATPGFFGPHLLIGCSSNLPGVCHAFGSELQ